MPGVDRVNGVPTTGAFYGLSPLVLKITNTATFTANSGGGTTAITEGGYAKAIKSVQTVGSIVWLGTQTDNSFACIVDGPTLNTGPGVTNTGLFGALKDALVSNVGGLAVEYQISSSTTFKADGTFLF